VTNIFQNQPRYYVDMLKTFATINQEVIIDLTYLIVDIGEHVKAKTRFMLLKCKPKSIVTQQSIVFATSTCKKDEW